MDNYRLIIDSAGFVNIFVSGCTINPDTNQRTIGYGIFWGEKNKCNVAGGSRKNTLENNAEIAAATLALKHAYKLNRLKKFCMNTSSNYLYSVLTQRIEYWKETDWRNESDGKKIKNASALKQLAKALRKLKEKSEIVFNYIPSGNVNQDKADVLAREGAEQHTIRLANRPAKVKKRDILYEN